MGRVTLTLLFDIFPSSYFAEILSRHGEAVAFLSSAVSTNASVSNFRHNAVKAAMQLSVYSISSVSQG